MARLIPQTLYSLYAYAQLKAQGRREFVFSVHSGNFGNIGAGLLSYKMGLPVKHFVAATNVNDTVPRFLQDGRYEPRPSVQTLANAMDVGNPSNWVRIMDMFDNDREVLSRLVSSYTFTDEETRDAIQTLFDRFGYVACPHTAIGWLGAERYREAYPGTYAAVFLSTAHPCKFPDVFPHELAAKIVVPVQVNQLVGREKQTLPMDVDFNAFKRYLMAGQ